MGERKNGEQKPPKDIAFRPLKELLVQRSAALDRLLAITGRRDTHLFGIALGQTDVYELYDLVENNDAVSLRLYLANLLGRETPAELLRSKIEPENGDRLPGMIISGRLIDFLNLLDPSEISYENAVAEVAKTVGVLNEGAYALYPGSDFDRVLGFCVGQALAISNPHNPLRDELGDFGLVQKFMNTYVGYCDEERTTVFMSGYMTGFSEGGMIPPKLNAYDAKNNVKTYPN